MVKLLLKFSPDVNSCDFYGKTPMTYAIEYDSVDIAKVINILIKIRYYSLKELPLGMIKTQVIRICVEAIQWKY